MITVNSLSVTLGGKQILSNICFSVEAGQWLMITAPNGAGKTTIVNAISQSIPYTGSVTVDGVDLRKLKSRALARRIGVLAQNRSVSYAFTVEEVVRLGCYSHRNSIFSARAEESEVLYSAALRNTGMEAFASRPVTTLSGGELQRTFLAQLFAQDPQVLILDEPTNHLDLVYQKQVLELVDAWRQEKERAVITVVHDLSMAKLYGTHALLLQNGRTAAFGPVQEILTPALLDPIYGLDVSGWMKKLYGIWEWP